MRASEFTDNRVMAKIERTGQIVQILRHEDDVKFSDDRGWFLVNTEPGRRTGTGVKWIPDSTRFTWIKNFDSLEESKTATSKEVLAYINRTHHEPFRPGEKMYAAVMAHPRWELQRVPLLNLNIPDQEYDDVDYDDAEPDADPYGRVMVVEPGHAGEVSQHLIDRNPIVIDSDRYIIDGNHRAWAAKYLLNRDYIMAWVPLQQKQAVAEGVDVTQELIATAKKHGGNLDDYFVRVTDQDKLGYSMRQHIGRSPDVDDPEFDIEYIGRGKGRPALWFYPLKYYVKNADQLYAADRPYVWLVRLKPDAWLQPADRKTNTVEPAPAGKQRVGIMRLSSVPAAIFFQPGFEVVDRWYDYAKMHKRRSQ